jgi:mono/diheme cytochrome c family protein
MNPLIQHSSNPLLTHFRGGFVLAIILAILEMACSPSPPPDITDPGQLIYLGYADKYAQCSRCHGPDGQGGMFGPSLHGAVKKLGADSVRQVIRFGRGTGDKRMEGFDEKLSPAQINQVIAFIETWADSSADSTSAYDSN